MPTSVRKYKTGWAAFHGKRRLTKMTTKKNAHIYASYRDKAHKKKEN